MDELLLDLDGLGGSPRAVTGTQPIAVSKIASVYPAVTGEEGVFGRDADDLAVQVKMDDVLEGRKQGELSVNVVVLCGSFRPSLIER